MKKRHRWFSMEFRSLTPPVIPQPEKVGEDFPGEYMETDDPPESSVSHRQTRINLRGEDFGRRRKRHKHE